MGARKNVRARGRHAREEGAPARKAPEKRFNSHSVSADISNWSRFRTDLQDGKIHFRMS